MTDWLAMFTRLMAEAINVVYVSVKYLKKNLGPLSSRILISRFQENWQEQYTLKKARTSSEVFN